MKKLLCVVPHLSTGGCPQFLVKKIELLKDNYDIHVIEWENFTGGVLVVQRNRILDLIPFSNFYSINGSNNELLNIINNIKPDIIHFEELPETFIADSALEQIYSKDRTYKIIETTHDSSFPTTIKRYFPDKFLFVSAYNAFKYINSDIPYEIIEYPVEQKIPNREECRKKLGFDDGWKHVINVGLFTPRKNQKYLFEIAEKLKEYKIKFHFIGNQADNFKSYWEPLIQNIPSNCKVWGERNDVEDFIQAADLSFFASKGDKNNKELNPIAIKEVLEYNIPMMLFNLDVYCGKYNNNPNISFLTGDLDKDTQVLVKLLQPTYIPSKNKEIVIIGTFPNTKDRIELTKQCIQKYKVLDRKIMLVSHYPVDIEIQKLVDFYFYDKHNPLLHHSYYKLFYNYTNEYDLNINLNGLKDSNQSLAVLTNLFNGFKSAKQLGFNKVFYTTYDVILHDNDRGVIDEGFIKLQTQDTYLSNTPNPLGKGVETTAMWWNIDKFLEIFDDVREKEDYNRVCSEINSENFLEHYMAKKVESNNIPVIDVPELTHLTHTGRGVQSNSEYFSILPVEGEINKYVIYFYTYNIDNRKIEFSIKEEGSPTSIDVIKVNEQKEYKKEITYLEKEIEVKVSYFDNDEIIKTDIYLLNTDNINTFKNTGFFKHKKKPKIKLIHLQTTNNDEREQISREQLSKLKDYGIEYVLHQNQPYKSLPPSHNCARPDCVSMIKFEEGHPLQGQALTPPHYGCFTSFRDGIISEFDKDLDFLIVCEGDCLLEVPHQEFVDKVYQACNIVKQNNIDYFSFGDTHTLEEGWFVSPVVEEIPGQDLLFITNKIIGIQCIMFPKRIKEFLFEKLKTHPWDAADLYFNLIFSNKKMGILKQRITTQVDGYSLIDKSLKTFRK
jgi:glycosyltransferase involved in cell wall biosynthesis